LELFKEQFLQDFNKPVVHIIDRYQLREAVGVSVMTDSAK
jgi:hypothetical protein